MALNQCTFLGRLTREPDIRYATETQMPIARFTLAVGRGTKKENEAEADFITCVAFDKRAEFVERYLGKGIRIVVSGRLQNNNYTDKDGNRVYGMKLTGRRKDSRAGDGECWKPGNCSKKCGSPERHRSQAGCNSPHRSSRKPDWSRAGRTCSQRTGKFHEHLAGCG